MNNVNQASDRVMTPDEGCLARPQREKFWKELSIEEKLERTNQVVRQLQRQVDNLSERLYTAEQTLANHQHGLIGQVLVSPNQRDNYPSAPKRNESGEDRYF